MKLRPTADGSSLETTDPSPAVFLELLEALAAEIETSQSETSGQPTDPVAVALRDVARFAAYAPAVVRESAVAPLLERAHRILSPGERTLPISGVRRRFTRPMGIPRVVVEDEEEETVRKPRPKANGLRFAS